MEEPELRTLVTLLRHRATDLPDLEAKAAAGGLPKSVRETLSAFSNDRGGVLLLGLDERADFAFVTPFDAPKIRNDLASICSTDLEPPVRATIEIMDIDGHQLVVAEVPELSPNIKPCYVKARGEYAGSFTRSGDGDRRLTDFEIHLLHTNRGQPQDDRAPVPGATPADLDPDAVSALLRRVRARQPRAFRDLDDETALRRLNVLTPTQSPTLAPTLAGMLALGSYPQQFYPQLNATFVVYPGRSADEAPLGAPRFLDNRGFDGPIPVIVDDALTAVMRNMSISARIEGAGRIDSYDYPVEALREAVVNALAHRDYSPYSHGTAVQIVMYADRLTISSPGGLYGTVNEADLGSEGVSSTRNPVLMRLLQDVVLPGTDRTVCENRGSGIPTMVRETRRAGSALPEFRTRINRFTVTFPKHALLDDETLHWIQGLGPALTPAQQMALALMKRGRSVTNQTLRNLGLDARHATTELGQLVQYGLAVRIGERRHSRYRLAEPAMDEVPTPPTGISSGRLPRLATAAPAALSLGAGTDPPTENRRKVLLAALSPGVEMSRRELQDVTGIAQATLGRLLAELVAEGVIVATAPSRSPHRRYRRP